MLCNVIKWRVMQSSLVSITGVYERRVKLQKFIRSFDPKSRTVDIFVNIYFLNAYRKTSSMCKRFLISTHS
jgi:hypothetical protein